MTPPNVSHPQMLLKRLLDVKKWSLRSRLVYTTGIILFTGAITTLFMVSFTLKKSAEQSVLHRVNEIGQTVTRHLEESTAQLLSSAVYLSTHPQIIAGVQESDSNKLSRTFSPINSTFKLLTGKRNPNIQVYDKDNRTLFSSTTISKKSGPEHNENIVNLTGSTLTALTGIQLSQTWPILSATVPVISEEKYVGTIITSFPLSKILERLASTIDRDYGFTLLPTPQDTEDDNLPTNADVIKQQPLMWGSGRDIVLPLSPQIAPTELPGQNGHYVQYSPLYDFAENRIGFIILHYDGSTILNSSRSTILFMSWLTVFGVALLSLSLYINVARIRIFFKKMQRLLIASHSNDFSVRFDVDPVHCCDVLECNHRECPVHQDPDKVCYLETGDKAISPLWRNTCIFLNTYKTCRECPVYKFRSSDELTEMKLILNTMMGLWGNFLGTVSNLLSDVFSTRSKSMVGLEDISHFLSQMAGITNYSHEIQGVFSKEEVYNQLSFVFTERFGLARFNLLEVNSSENRMESVVSKDDLAASHVEVFINCDQCRAKRHAEDVISENNPHICPYFGVEHSQEVRCCLPMVMGGRVGAVFTFIVERATWKNRKQDLLILKKYLEETAPILASLRLLQISKEQALKDPLTNCHNRRFMDEYLVQFESLHARNPRKLGFIMADLDHFKMVNDEYGHLAGDEVLKQLADIMRKNIRKSDLLIRYGGEEFLIILMEISSDGLAKNIAEKLRLADEKAHLTLPGGGYITKTLSMGVAEFPANGNQLYKVIKYADVALYQAKEQGRNKVISFSEEMWKEDAY